MSNESTPDKNSPLYWEVADTETAREVMAIYGDHPLMDTQIARVICTPMDPNVLGDPNNADQLGAILRDALDILTDMTPETLDTLKMGPTMGAQLFEVLAPVAGVALMCQAHTALHSPENVADFTRTAQEMGATADEMEAGKFMAYAITIQAIIAVLHGLALGEVAIRLDRNDQGHIVSLEPVRVGRGL